MIEAVWRVGGDGFSVDAFARRFPEVQLASAYRRGERVLRSRPPAEHDGFTAVLASGAGGEEVVAAFRARVEAWRAVFEHVRALGVSSVVDFGLLPSGDVVVHRVHFDASVLALCIEHGLELAVSGYPRAFED